MRWLGILAAVGVLLAGGSARADEPIECDLTYSLKGWSAFYRTSKGDGTISCSNGQRVAVRITTHGGGITFGTYEVRDGKGSFSNIWNMSQLYGGYAEVGGHAGAGPSVGGRAMTKGDVGLALSGKGQGINLGFAFGAFIIDRK